MDFADTKLPGHGMIAEAFDVMKHALSPAGLEEAVESTRVLAATMNWRDAEWIAAHLVAFGTLKFERDDVIPWQGMGEISPGVKAIANTLYTQRMYTYDDAPAANMGGMTKASEIAHATALLEMEVKAAGMQPAGGYFDPTDEYCAAMDDAKRLRRKAEAYGKAIDWVGTTGQAALEARYAGALKAAVAKADALEGPQPQFQEIPSPVFNTAAGPEPEPQIDWNAYTHVHPVIRRQQGISLYKNGPPGKK